MKALLIFVALFAFVHADPFQVTIQLSSKPFQEIQNAELRMWLALPEDSEAIYFLVDTGDMVPSKNFTREVNINFDPTEIDRSAFYWMQPESITTWRNPAVFLDHVMITGSIEREGKPRRDITIKLIPVYDEPIEANDKTALKVDYMSG